MFRWLEFTKRIFNKWEASSINSNGLAQQIESWVVGWSVGSIWAETKHCDAVLQADAQHDELKKQNAELENKLESLRKDVRLT